MNDARDTPLGRLEVVTGPMFAGKTTHLLERLGALEAEGMRTLACKPRIDDRYHPTDIVTHAGASIPARAIDHPRELDALVREHDPGALGLDEAHFFESGLRDALHPLLARGLHIVVAGLDRTSLNEPFGEMGALLIEADEVVKRTAPCAVCKRPAVHTIRLFDSTERIVVGGEGMFENRCRAHLHSKRPQPPLP